MRIGIIGPGNIGGNAARQFVRAGHDVLLSFSHDAATLTALASELGPLARAGSPREAAAFGPVVFLSVPWTAIDLAIGQAGSLDGKIVVDTTNQYGHDGLEKLPPGKTAAQVNAARLKGARVVKSFNTLTSSFQASAAWRTGADRAVLFLCGDDTEAKAVVSKLIEQIGFVPVDLGGLADAAPMEAPRRPGALYGEEYRESDARAYVAAIRRGDSPPPAPQYARTPTPARKES